MKTARQKKMPISGSSFALGIKKMPISGSSFALGVLTQDADSPLNRRMEQSFALAMSAAVHIRWVVFEDEHEAEKRRHPGVAATRRRAARAGRMAILERPSFVSQLPQYQCVAKILAWLQHVRATLSSRFLAWVDSDTWLMPTRLEALLQGVEQSIGPQAASRSWIGTFMHFQRFDPALLDGLGLQYHDSPSEESRARRLVHDAPHRRVHAEAHRHALGRGRSALKQRFTFAQGSFVAYGYVAVDELLHWVRTSDAARAFLGLGGLGGLGSGSSGGLGVGGSGGGGGSTDGSTDGSGGSGRSGRSGGSGGSTGGSTDGSGGSGGSGGSTDGTAGGRHGRRGGHGSSSDDVLSNPLPTARAGKCTLQGDVGMGWITTRAFGGNASSLGAAEDADPHLTVVHMWSGFELFVWPSLARFNANHTVVVHLANVKTYQHELSALLSDLDRKVASSPALGKRGRKTKAAITPLVRPRYTCAPTRWKHVSNRRRWVECTNRAHCGPVLASGAGQLHDHELYTRFVPSGARDVCTTPRPAAGAALRRRA